MTPVLEIWDDIKKILGNPSDVLLFRRLTQAVELLSSKGDFDAMLGLLDICTSGKVITLPPEVETIIALNMTGRPAMARDEIFQFHLNGMGNCGCAIRPEWTDLSTACTYRELACPGKLFGYCVEDADVNCDTWVRGLDTNQNVIRTKLSDGTLRDGWKLPVFRSQQALPADAPIFWRITDIQKPVTAGPIRMTTIGGAHEILLGVYQANETSPRFRRIQLSECADWVRIKFRRKNLAIHSRYDLLPVEPAIAVVMAVRALKAYDTVGEFAQGEAFEATALRWMSEFQLTHSSPVVQPIQVSDAASLSDGFDFIE